MRLVEHKELKCPKCGGKVIKILQGLSDRNLPDYKCNECGVELDLIW